VGGNEIGLVYVLRSMFDEDRNTMLNNALKRERAYIRTGEAGAQKANKSIWRPP